MRRYVLFAIWSITLVAVGFVAGRGRNPNTLKTSTVDWSAPISVRKSHEDAVLLFPHSIIIDNRPMPSVFSPKSETVYVVSIDNGRIQIAGTASTR